MKAALIDTSSILFALRYRKDLFERLGEQFPDCKPVISRGVVGELKAMGANRGKRGALARLALMMLKSKKVEIHNIGIDPDRWIQRQAARSRGRMVVTNDSELARKASAIGARCFKVSRSGSIKRYLW